MSFSPFLYRTLIVLCVIATFVTLMASFFVWKFLYKRFRHVLPPPPAIEIGTGGLRILPLSGLGNAPVDVASGRTASSAVV
jgi:H+/Cl- antiporter ClcA